MFERFNNLRTMGENMRFLKICQYKRASEKINRYNMVGAPTFRNMKIMIRQDIIQNCSVTVEDIEIAEKVFGHDVSTELCSL